MECRPGKRAGSGRRTGQKTAKKVKLADSSLKSANFTGTAEGIRTPDLLVRSQTLYPAELQPRIAPLSLFIIPHPSGKCKCFFQIFLLFLFFAVCLQKSVGRAGNLCYNNF